MSNDVMSIKKERGQLYKSLATLSFPIIIQNFLASSLNLVDSLMIGKISAENSPQIAAVGFANQIFFAISLFMFGLTCAAQVFTAQYYGKGDYDGIRKALVLGLISCGGFCLIFQVIGCLFPNQLIGLFTKDAYVISLGAEYLRIVAWSYFITGLTFVYSGVMRSMRSLKLPMLVSIIGIVVNTILNYIFIYGKLGFPAMGVAGAAWATLIARILQIIIILAAVYLPQSELALKLKDFIILNKDFLKRYFKTSLPIVLNEGLWGIGTSLYTVVYGLISTEAAAATRLAGTLEQFAWIFIASIGTVCAIIIGNELGEGKADLARRNAARMNKIMIVCALVLCGLMMASAKLFTSLYDINDYTRSVSVTLIYILALVTPLKAMNYNMNIGIFRSGGDTTFPFLLEIALVWGVSAPLGYLLGIPLGMGIIPAYLIVHIDELIKLPIFLLRMRTGKWAKNLTETKSEE